MQEALSYVGTCGVGVLIRGLKLLVYEALRDLWCISTHTTMPIPRRQGQQSLMAVLLLLLLLHALVAKSCIRSVCKRLLLLLCVMLWLDALFQVLKASYTRSLRPHALVV